MRRGARRRRGCRPGRERASRPSAFSAKSANRPRSRSISASAFGRWTLTTTRSPPSRRARCTWPIVPAASGSGSMLSNTSSQGTPSSSSITCTTSASVSGGTRSWRLASSSASSGGIRSGRVESIWPSLQNVGPSSSSAARSRAGAGASSVLEPAFRPCFATTAAICAARAVSCPPASSRHCPAPGQPPLLLGSSAVFTITTVQRRVVRDAVRDVAEQELLAAAHADVADHEHVRLLGLGRGDDRVAGSSPAATRALVPGPATCSAYTASSVSALRPAAGPARTPGRSSAAPRSGGPSPPPRRPRATAVSERSEATTMRSIATDGSSCRARKTASEKVGKGWIMSRSTSSGTSARIASVSCWHHSPGLGPTATAPTRTRRFGSAATLTKPGRFGFSYVEAREVDGQLPAASDEPVAFGVADRRHLRVGEGDRRDRPVVGPRARGRRRSAAATRAWYLPDVREQGDAGAVADRPDALGGAEAARRPRSRASRSSTPSCSRPSPSTFGLRPVATSSRSASSSSPSASVDLPQSQAQA